MWKRLAAIVAGRQQVVAELIDGRLSLLEAAWRFQNPGRPLAGPVAWTDLLDGEALCRNLIGWVHLALRNHPAVVTQSIGEEPQRRVVILRREASA